jgi:hypothetical protein
MYCKDALLRIVASIQNASLFVLSYSRAMQGYDIIDWTTIPIPTQTTMVTMMKTTSKTARTPTLNRVFHRPMLRLAASLDKQRNIKVPHSKVCEPDQFDESDACKLCAFLVQLEFTFNDRPTVFKEGRIKVNYTLFYLKGTALEWIEPGLALRGGLAEPAWLTSWIVFIDELHTNFGPSLSCRN